MSLTASAVSSKKVFPPQARQALVQLLGTRAVLDRKEDLTLYEYDGGVDKHRPDLVVFPRTAEQVKQIVDLAQRYGLQFVGRGAGTGLSGGVIPRCGGLMVSFARMNQIEKIDLDNERVQVQAGVVNLEVTLAVQRDG